MTAAEHPPVVDREPRCWRCNKKLAIFLSRPWRIECVRCKATNASPQADTISP
jgi:phage FluMu protein Com